MVDVEHLDKMSQFRSKRTSLDQFQLDNIDDQCQRFLVLWVFGNIDDELCKAMVKYYKGDLRTALNHTKVAVREVEKIHPYGKEITDVTCRLLISEITDFAVSYLKSIVQKIVDAGSST